MKSLVLKYQCRTAFPFKFNMYIEKAQISSVCGLVSVISVLGS